MLYNFDMDGYNNPVRDAIVHEIRFEMYKKEVRQIQLAKALGMTRQNLNNLLTTRSHPIPTIWSRALEALELELVVVPKYCVPNIEGLVGLDRERELIKKRFQRKEKK